MIAFTSDFIPKLVYRYHYGHGEMDGFVQFTLSRAPADHWIDEGKVSVCEEQMTENKHYIFRAIVTTKASETRRETSLLYTGTSWP